MKLRMFIFLMGIVLPLKGVTITNESDYPIKVKTTQEEIIIEANQPATEVEGIISTVTPQFIPARDSFVRKPLPYLPFQAKQGNFTFNKDGNLQYSVNSTHKCNTC